MFRITAELKKFATETLGVAADATDEAIRSAVFEGMVEGKIDKDTLKRLTKADEGEQRVRSIVGEEFTKMGETLTKSIVSQVVEQVKAVSVGQTATETPPAAPPETKGNAATNPIKAFVAGATAVGSDGASATDDILIRVKDAVERYPHTPTAATWEKSTDDVLRKTLGARQVMSGKEGVVRPLDMPTPRTTAIAGAWFKHMINRDLRRQGRVVPPEFRMTEHDRQLVAYAVHKCAFIGPIEYDDRSHSAKAWFDNEPVSDPLFQKTLLDDTTSGGIEAVPIEFDAAYILTPLLTGQLYPFVNQVVVGRRRIEGTKIGNPTLAWGASEGSSIGLFNTDSLISEFNTDIWPVAGAMEIGLDFEADSPLEVGNILVGRYGLAFRKEMDTVIATGNGTNQPLGLTNTPSTVAVTSANGPGGAPAVTDYENLFSGVPAEYRDEAGDSSCFIGTETSYFRARGIPVGAADARRIFGVEGYDSRRLMDRRYAFVAGVGNATIMHACLNRYRFYRRAGLEVRVVTEDATLARQNKRLIIVRARVGGKLEDGNACAIITDAQA